MKNPITQYLLGAVKDQSRLCRGGISFVLGKWQKLTFTTTVVAGLLMMGSLAVAQPSNLGDDQAFRTKTDLARATMEVNSAYTEAKQHPGTNAQYALAVALERMADLQASRAKHIFPYNEGYMAALELARNNKKSHRYTSDLMSKVERLETTAAPDSEQTLWEFRDAARRSYRAARVIYQQLAASEPKNLKLQRALAVNLIKTNPGYVGSEEVRAYYQRALTIFLHLVKSEPSNEDFLRDLAVAYETIADQLNSMTGSMPTEYDDALAIRMKLFRHKEENPIFVQELAITFSKIGDALVIRGKWKAARNAVTDEFGLYQVLATIDPANMEWQRALATAHMHLAAIKNHTNRGEEKLDGEVLAHYDKALKIRLYLIQVNPSNTEWQMDLMESYRIMAEFYDNRDFSEKTLISYIDAQRMMAQFAQRYPKDRGWLFYQLYYYFSVGYENRKIQLWASPFSQGGKLPDPEKFKAAVATQEDVFKKMVEIIDTLVRMTGAPQE